METAWTSGQLDRWEKIRRGGRMRYILLYGVLGWGLPTLLLFSLIRGWVEGRVESILATVFDPMHLVIWALAGVVFGALMWRWSERIYERRSDED
ncbi:MAG: hypothetical protein EP335_08205 [Alphaproteobacteria bacterium]|nr:MAG: hypothetical protein EP335_08205 [Alphaproteobacteria bacterium]